jgi:hypothetical protein
MIKRTFYTTSGEQTRELTAGEIDTFASQGDNECRKEVLKADKAKAGTLQARIEAIEKYLGV